MFLKILYHYYSSNSASTILKTCVKTEINKLSLEIFKSFVNYSELNKITYSVQITVIYTFLICDICVSIYEFSCYSRKNKMSKSK